MRKVSADSIALVSSFSIAVVVSRFNSAITENLREGTLEQLKERGVSSQDILLVEVPGAIEIPLIVKQLAKSQQVKVVIALGAVIQGETRHFDYVCQQLSQGCQRIALDYDIPVIFGVLTTENEAQAWERLGGSQGHKGKEAADCAIAMFQITSQLDAILYE